MSPAGARDIASGVSSSKGVEVPTVLYRLAAVWTAFGLASGLFYREFTKLNGVPGGTQLAVVHTHALTLGTIVLLVALALILALPALGERGAFRVFVWVWNIGLAIATLGMLTKGILQVSGNAFATSPMIAGISGLGHMTLTAAFIIFFVALGRTLRARGEQAGPNEPAPTVELNRA